MGENGKSEGACAFCGKRATRGGMSRHLRTCAARKAAIQAVDERPGEPVPVVHLLVQDSFRNGPYWLHLEVNGTATLAKLDEYLGAIWLECCGHMSRFSPNGWGSGDVAMSRKVAQAFPAGQELTHTYDFGDSTLTRIRAVEVRMGKPLTKRPVVLMARNEAPDLACAECGAPATRLCIECMYAGAPSTLCDAHAESHPHDDYGEPMALVNSPRTGVCGYDGPAEPPYQDKHWTRFAPAVTLYTPGGGG